jgi:selenocysteine-specific elongation factor
VTVGGGRVLRRQQTGRYRRRQLGAELSGIVAAGDRPEARVDHELGLAAADGRTVDDLAHALEVDEVRVLAVLAAMPHVHLHSRAMRAFSLPLVDAGERELLESVDRILAKRSVAASIKRTALRTSKTLPQPMIDAVLDRMLAAGRVRAGSQGQLLFVERLRPLAAADQQRLDAVVAACEQRGFRPPDLAELQQATGIAEETLLGLLDRARDEAQVEQVGEHFYGAKTLHRALLAIRRNCLRHGEALEIPELRDEFDTSRKYLIPLLEHVDELGLTVLRGGVRRLLSGSELNQRLAQQGG